jgi:hypothetical protein
MGNEERMMERCRKLGKVMPISISKETLKVIFTKIIVEEKVNDDDAFEMASKSFKETFECME